ncbi:MAG: cardiolipin synthase ClsB [Rhodoferax sp.]
MNRDAQAQANRVRLIQGGDALIAAMVQAVEASRTEVRIETYIFDLRGAPQQLALSLMRAAQRGVRVMVLVDAVGSAPTPPDWVQRFAEAGVQWQRYNPVVGLGWLMPGQWRRLHRKLAVIDDTVAFCGGINLLDDRLTLDGGTLARPRFDFAVQVHGPLVAAVYATVHTLWWRVQLGQQLRHREWAAAWDAVRQARRNEPPSEAPPTVPAVTHAALVLRDNLRHRTRIERSYRRALERAEHEVWIANAYFLPGRRLRHALITAAQRGVRVHLLLQGRYDNFWQYYATRALYGGLLRAGVAIFEYQASFLHAKVAVVDGHWATVGSSNLDPLSLLLAREANVVVQDAPFAASLRQALVQACRNEAVPVTLEQLACRSLWRRWQDHAALWLMRLILALTGKRY